MADKYTPSTDNNAAIDPGNVNVDTLSIPGWLKEGLKKLDLDGDGLEESEISDMLTRVAEEKRMAKNNSDELHYSHMPEKVQEVMRMWDQDLSGTVSVVELTAAAKAQQALQQENRVVKRLLFAAVLVIILLAVLNFVMSLAAVETGKDFKPQGSSGRRLSTASGGTGGKGALADTATGVLMGTAVPMETYTDLKDFHLSKPPKEMLDTIRTYSFFDPAIDAVTNRKIKKAEFVDGDLVMFDMHDNELLLLEDGTTVETKKEGSARVVHSEKPNALLKRRDAGKQELKLESLPEAAAIPTGAKVPSMAGHCPLQDGVEKCTKTGLKAFVREMFLSGEKGGITGYEPSSSEVDTFFDVADCDADGLVSKSDLELAENGVPCAQHRRRLREVHSAHRPYRVRRLEAERHRRLTSHNNSASLMPDVGPPDNCIPVIENAHVLLHQNPSTKQLPRKKRGPAMARLLSLDSNGDGCVDDMEHKALKISDLEGGAPQDCSKIKPPRSCRCLPEGVDSIRLENAMNLLPQCHGQFYKLDRDGNGVVTRKECDEGSASKSEDDFFKMLQYDGTCPQNTALINLQAFVDFKVGEKGEDPVQAEIYAKVADMDGDGLLDMVEAASSPKSIFNDLHGNYTDQTVGRLLSPTGNKRRLRLIRTLIEPRIAKRAHDREQRRLQRELEVRGRMLEKAGSVRFGRWLQERMEIGKSRRRLMAGQKDEFLKEDFAGMTTEELTGKVASWEQSARHRALESRFSASLPPSTRRLLGINSEGRRLETFTAEELDLQTEITTMFSSVDTAAIQQFVEEHAEEVWDTATKEKYTGCPSPFYLHRSEDGEVDDENTVHHYAQGTDILTGPDAVDAIAATLGVTNEQAEHKIMHLYGLPGAVGDQGRRQRLRRLAELDPLHRRRLQGGEFDGVDPLNDVPPVPSLDQCEFLKVVDRQQFDKLMSDEAAQMAYYQGGKDYCYKALEAVNQGSLGADCVMPTNTYIDPSTHEVRRDNPEGTIAPFQFAAAQTLDDPACAKLPWEEKIMPTRTDATGRVERDPASPYADNWDHQKPGRGCAVSCCTTGNMNDCAGDKRIKDCPCLKEKKKCMRRLTDKLITAKSGGSGTTQRRMRRLTRRLTRRNVVAQRRRMRRLSKLLPFEGRQLMAQDRAHRMDRRRLNEMFEEGRNRDGSHDFCSMHNGYADPCRWDFGCTWIPSTSKCQPCGTATVATECSGTCIYSSGTCSIPDECTSLTIADACDTTAGCTFVGTCRRCHTLAAYECAGPGCRLNGEGLCVANDFLDDGPGGRDFHYDCPLGVTAVEAACAIDPTLPCAAGPPSDALLKQHYDLLTDANKELLTEMTSPGLSTDTRTAMVEHLTVQEHPIDYDDIDALDPTNPRRLQAATTVEIPILDASMYSQEDTFMHVSTNGQTMSSTDAIEFLTECGAQEQVSPAAGEIGDSFCEEIHRVDTAMRALGNEEYEVEFHEAHELAEDTLADHLMDIGGEGGIDRPMYTCACTQIHHMARDECGAHYDTTAENGITGMTFEEFTAPPPALYAQSAAEEQPLTPDAEFDHAVEFDLFEHHDYIIDRIEMAAASLFWEIYGAADTNNIVRRRMTIADKDLEGTFDQEDDEPPACDPVQSAQLTRSSFEFFQSEIEELRFALTELENFFQHDSTIRRLSGHSGMHRRLQEFTSSDLRAAADALRVQAEAALTALRTQLDANTMTYVLLYNTPVEVLDLVCIYLRPENLPFRRRNVVPYDPFMFEFQWEEEPMCGVEDAGEWGEWSDMAPFPGEPISLQDLNPVPELAFEMPATSRCDINPAECTWQGEDPFVFGETNIATGTTIGKAMRWDTAKVNSDIHHVDPAAARVMETKAWPWESTVEEFVASMDMVKHAADAPANKRKFKERMRKANTDASDPSFAADLTLPKQEKAKSTDHIRGLFEVVKPVGLEAIPHPIDPTDDRSAREACKQYAGVESGLQTGDVATTGVFSSPVPVDLFEKCTKHRVQQRAFEVMNDVRHGIANEKATATVTARLRRRLAEAHGGEDNFSPEMRRLFAQPEDTVNPLTLMRKHEVHRKRAHRAHARRLRAQHDRRARVLRRRLETGDDSLEIPTVGHDFAPSVVDRMLLSSDATEATTVLANAEKELVMAEFDTQMRQEMALLKDDVVLDNLSLDDYDILLRTMHEFYASFVPATVGAGDNEFGCLNYNPNPDTAPLTAGVVTFSAADKDTFKRCTEQFNSGVPEEAAYFAGKIQDGEVSEEQFFEEAFAGLLPADSEVALKESQERKIHHNKVEFHKDCYCECKENALYGKPLQAMCSRNPTIGGSLDAKTVCQIIGDAKMEGKQKKCAPAGLRRLSIEEPSCVSLNGEEYCKVGAARLRQLSTRQHPGRRLAATRSAAKRQLGQTSGGRRKLTRKHRRKFAKALQKKAKRSRRSRR